MLKVTFWTDLPGASGDWCDQCELECGSHKQWPRWLGRPDGVRGHPGIGRIGRWGKFPQGTQILEELCRKEGDLIVFFQLSKGPAVCEELCRGLVAMGGLPNQGPSKFIIILIYLVAFAIIISFHILLYLFTSFHISVYWQVDVPKTQILLGSKGSSGFVVSLFYFLSSMFTHAQYLDKVISSF